MTTNRLIWALIVLFFVITAVSSFDWGLPLNNIMPVLSVISLFLAVWVHGIIRYGVFNFSVFFIITWIVSLSFEALSIQMGFPFGHYHYDQLAGPRILEVPIVIMFGYFGMAYVSWVLSHVLLGQYEERLKGLQIFLIPLIATFIMVMWDLVMDPLSSTIGLLWVWRDGGLYYGVPFQNYFGWFFVVYIFFQIFALYISKFDVLTPIQRRALALKTYWYQAAFLYGIQALFQILSPFTVLTNPEIYQPMALITLFTMMFVTLLSIILINQSSKVANYS